MRVTGALSPEGFASLGLQAPRGEPKVDPGVWVTLRAEEGDCPAAMWNATGDCSCLLGVGEGIPERLARGMLGLSVAGTVAMEIAGTVAVEAGTVTVVGDATELAVGAMAQRLAEPTTMRGEAAGIEFLLIPALGTSTDLRSGDPKMPFSYCRDS